jgi:hypothetical protein
MQYLEVLRRLLGQPNETATLEDDTIKDSTAA